METFYDREQIRNTIKEIVNSCNETVVLLIVGYTGVGKSALLDHLAKDHFFDRDIITLKNSARSANSNESGYYLRTLYKQFIENPLFHNYHPISMAAKKGIELIMGIGKNHVNLADIKLREDKDNPSFIQMKDYLIHALNRKSIIVNIENFHKIDAASQDYLYDIIKSTNNTVFIFQYTITDDPNNVRVKQDELEKIGVALRKIEIKSLDFDIAKHLLPERYSYTAQELESLYQLYQRAKGNLFELKYYEKENNISISQIKEKLKSLDDSILYILFLIAYARGIIYKDELYKMILSKENCFLESYTQIEEQLHYLEQNELVQYYDDQYKIYDSIINELEHFTQGNNKRIIKEIAYNTALHYYMKSHSETNATEYLYHIFYITLLGNDPTLLQYLTQIKKEIIKKHNPAELIKDLENFTRFINDKSFCSSKQKDKLLYTLIEIFLSFHYSDKAESYMKQITNKNTDSYILLQSELLVQKSDFESLNKLKDIYMEIEKENRLKLCVALSQLHLMMRLCRHSESKAFAKKILTNRSFQSMPEYSFALVNYAEYLETKEAITFYNDAINRLSDTTLSDYTNLIRSNLIMCYGYLNDIAHAREELQKIKFDNDEIEEAYYNNLSAIEIIENQVTKSTIKNLNNALLLSKHDFTRIIIHSNLLICYIKMKNFDAAFTEMNYLTSTFIERYKSETLQFMVYRNLIFYAEVTQDHSLYENYRKKLEALLKLESISNTGLAIIGKAFLTKSIDDHYFYTRLQYYPEFICYWGIPLLLDSR